MGENKSLQKYDLIVLGSGPAGEKGAAQAAYFGKKVAIVEKDEYLGGAAAGTAIPSKTLRETSLALSAIHSRRLYGVDLSLKREATVRDFLHHERNVKDTERKRVKKNMQLHKVDIYKGKGFFLDGKTIRVEGKDKKFKILKGDIILIATGSKPRRSDIFPNNTNIYDSDTILDIKLLPKNMVVVGAGVIGLEYACIFSLLGVNVTLIHNREILLPFLDRDISFTLEKMIKKNGINLLKNQNVESCNIKEIEIELKVVSGKNIITEAVLLATGRTSNIEELNLKSAGIITGKYDRLVVNQNYQVIHPETKKTFKGIFAVGDVIGPPALASTSMEQARYAMIKAFDLEPYKDHVVPILPLGIYTIPECSMAGKTEEECKEEKIDYVTGKASYNKNARGMIIGDNDGFLKLIFKFNKNLSKPMKLLGVHVIGELASELIHFGVSALIMNAGSDLFINTCFNYPTLSELYKYATYQAMGKRENRLKSS
jgi:NAD(P) transhydrogenase